MTAAADVLKCQCKVTKQKAPETATINLTDSSGLFAHYNFKEINCRPHTVDLSSEYTL
jgi:hypothetical protein